MWALLQEHREAIWWIAAFSGMVFIGSIIVVPWLVVRIPEDYFLPRKRPRLPFADQHPILRWTGLIIKNLAGGILVLAGLAMLLLPGQGLLTIVVGVLLLDFPGKHRLEGKIIRIGPVLKSVNWLRAKANATPLRLEESSAHEAPSTSELHP